MNEGKEFKKAPQGKIPTEQGDRKKKETELSDDDLKNVSGGCFMDHGVYCNRVKLNRKQK